MHLLLSAFVLIMCKKIPAELGLKKIDILHEKIKILRPPQDASPKAAGAVVRITV